MRPLASVLVLAALVLLPPAARAQGNDADRAARAKLENARVELNFRDASVAEVVQYLREASGLNILLDSRLSQEMDVDGMTVNLSLKNVRLVNALRWLVRGRGMAFKVVDGVVLITTEQAAAGLPVLRLYDVADILSQPRDFPAEGPAESTAIDEGTLLDLIQTFVAPDSWGSQPNSIESVGTTLVVVADPARLEQVDRFLAALRVISHFAVTVDARVLDLSRQACPGAPALGVLAPGKALLTREEAAALLARAGDDVRVLEAARFSCMNGQRVNIRMDRLEGEVLGVQSREPATAGQVRPVANDRRTLIEVDPVLVAGRDEFVVDLRALIADPALLPVQLHAEGGRVECPRRSEREIRTSFLVPNGSAALFVLGASGDRVRALLLRVTAAASALATSTPVEPLPPADDAAAAAFRDFLARKASLEFNGTPFSEVLAYLRELTGANLLLDPELISEGYGDAWVVTLKLKDVEMKTVLDLLSGMFDITYVPRDDAVVLARRSRAEECRLELYDVRDILRARRNWPGPEVDPSPARESGVFVGDTDETEAASSFDEDSLVELIRSTVEPTSWEDEGARIETLNGVLIVSQHPSAHRGIAAFLNHMRSSRPRQVQVDARILDVDPSVHDVLDAGGDGPLPDKSRAELERALADGRARTATAWSFLGPNACRFHASQTLHRAWVKSNVLESGVAAPEYEWLRGAHVLDVLPTLIPSEPGRLVVELRAGCSDLPEGLPTASAGVSVVEKPRAETARLATMVVTRSGETRMVSLGNVTGAKGERRRVLVWTVRVIE